MAKVICRECGEAYDQDEWAECPTCAKIDYLERKQREKRIGEPTPNPHRPWYDGPWWRRTQVLS